MAPTMSDAADMLWVVLANVSGGDWTKQTPDWQEAAARWRDNYFEALKSGLAEVSSPASQQDENDDHTRPRRTLQTQGRFAR